MSLIHKKLFASDDVKIIDQSGAAAVSARIPVGGEEIPVPGVFISYSEAFIPLIMVFYRTLLSTDD